LRLNPASENGLQQVAHATATCRSSATAAKNRLQQIARTAGRLRTTAGTAQNATEQIGQRIAAGWPPLRLLLRTCSFQESLEKIL
jgi:hypothetical protein